MATTYQLDFSDPFGTPLGRLRQVVKLDLVLSENEVGKLSLDLAGEQIPWSWLRWDTRIEVNRQVEGFPIYLEGNKTWLIQDWYSDTDQQGLEIVHIEAVDANDLLRRHVIPFDKLDTGANDPQAYKYYYLDDMMKDIVRQQMGASATDTLRSWAALLLVQDNASKGLAAPMNFPRRKVLDVCRDICDASRQMGMPLYFDIVKRDSALEFQTFPYMRGEDHSATSGKQVIASRAAGNLASPRLGYSFASAANAVYAQGQGVGNTQMVTTSLDTARIGLSPFGRVEIWADNGSASGIDQLQAFSDLTLATNRPRRIFEGRVLDSDQAFYGVHYHLGDLITCQHKGIDFDVHINKVSLSLNGVQETVDIICRSEDYV